MTNKELKSIDVIFENCEYVSIPRKYIGQLGLEDIERSIRRWALNSVTDKCVAETVALEFSGDLKKEIYHPFGISDETSNIFERLKKYPDITSIDIHWNILKDNSREVVGEEEEHILVRWGEDDYTNEYETIYESPLGNLYIVISKDKTFDDMFDKEMIDADDYFSILKTVDDYI